MGGSRGTYGVLAASYAAHLRRMQPQVPVVAGTGMVHPTGCEDLLQAREQVRVEDVVPLALRRWRKAGGLSQREAAAALGVPESRVARCEADPGRLKLETVLALLRAAGYDLQVVDREERSPLSDLRADELLARTLRGSRFRAAGEVVRLTREPRWLAERGESYLSEGPLWTSERRPGSYP